MRRLAVAASAAALSVLLAACSSSSHTTATATSPPTAQTSAAPAGGAYGSPAAGATTGASAPGITIDSFAYSGTMTVKAGEKITVTNKDSVAHTLTDKSTHKFDTGNIAVGGTATFTAPTKPGSYPFGCTYHSDMHGTLVVTG